MSKGDLVINQINKSFNVDGKEVNILSDINIEIKAGEFIAIVGHSGCGKSTLLKIISGLLKSDLGEVSIDGNKIDKPGRDRGMVFQEHRLFPWLKLKDNIALSLDDIPKSKREDIVNTYLKLVGLEGFENAYPSQLSGGMSQRAAIARAIVNNPNVLLLDEPFGALDALTKIRLQQEILKIWQEQKSTMVLVTHDIEEAVYLADRIIVMSANPGKIAEIVEVGIGRPRDRGSSDFAHVKREIYRHFFKDEILTPEYSI